MQCGSEHPAIKASKDDHLALRRDRGVTVPRSVSAQLGGTVQFVPGVAMDVVDEEVGTETLGTVREGRVVVGVPPKHKHESRKQRGAVQEARQRSRTLQGPATTIKKSYWRG